MKRAGFDAVIIEDSSARPVYLSIDDGEAEIRSAGHVWGKTSKGTQETIRQEIGDELVRIVSSAREPMDLLVARFSQIYRRSVFRVLAESRIHETAYENGFPLPEAPTIAHTQ